MTGWKTKLAGAGAILTGLSVVVANVSPFVADGVLQGVLVVLGGLATIGLGHKIEKLKGIFEKILSESK